MHALFKALLLVPAAALLAEPEKPLILSGEVKGPFFQNGEWVMQSGTRAIVQWDQFSIQAGECFRFEQADRGSAILNRVVGPAPSHILGQLLSNGAVYLVNPNGVLVGLGAQIKTAGFIASSLDILDADFLEGHLQFTGSGIGEVINLGNISCSVGNVALIGRKVENRGNIEAPQGGVALLSSLSVLLQPEGEPHILIQPELERGETGEIDGAAVENSGAIQALVVDLQSGANPYAKAIRSSGEIRASSVVEKGGRVFLVASEGVCELSGLIDVSGVEGGEVRLLGTDVHLLNGSTIEASGQKGGGEILLGGDYQGSNPKVQNAKHVWAGEETLVRADAWEEGNGGKVIFWSDEATFHYGKISVCGGIFGGDGGLAEVSGKLLEYRGFTEGKAPLGIAGQLLLDPSDIVIGNSATSGSFTGCGSPPSTYTIAAGTATNQILNTDLQTQLGSCSVTISTVGGGGSGTDGGSITVSSALTWATANTLMLKAAAFININATISNTSASTGFDAMEFYAAGWGNTGANNGITVSSALSSVGGNILLFGNASNAATAGNGVSVGAGISTTAGSISIAGAVPSGPTSSSVGVAILTPNITSSSGNIFVSGTSLASGTGSHGVNLNPGSLWATLSSGSLIFGSTISFPGVGSISGCQGGSGSASHGLIAQTATFNGYASVGSIQGTNSIIGGTGDGSCGFVANDSFFSTTGSISFTASTQAQGSSPAYGILTTGLGAQPWQVNNVSGTIKLIGTVNSLNNSGASAGLYVNGTVFGAGVWPTVVSLAGQVLTGSTGSAVGLIAGGLIRTTTGAANLSGTSASTGSGSHGVSAQSLSMSTVTTATFGATITDGTVTITGCQGGSGSASHGINSSGVTVSVSGVGGVVATNSIIGGTGTGSHGFSGPIQVTSGTLAITASTLAGGSTASHGIAITSGSIQSTGTMTLNGTASSSNSGNSSGIYVNGGTISGPGTITGTVPSGASVTGSSPGIFMGTTNGIVGGAKTISGTSGSTGSGSHGFQSSASWTTGSSGLITFSTCHGGSGAASHGVYIQGAFSTAGSVTATNSIVGGSGTGSYGFITGSTFASSGAGVITISASTLAAGSSAIFLGDNLTTTNGSISLTGSILLGKSLSISSGSSGGNVALAGDVTGSGDSLTLNSGAGTVSSTGSFDLSGTNGGSLTITSFSGFTYGQTVNTSGTSNGGNVSITSGNGAVSLSWTLNVSGDHAGSLTISAHDAFTYGSQINTVGTTSGGAVSITSTNGSVTLAGINSSGATNGGNVSITSSTSSVSLSGTYNLSAASAGSFTVSSYSDFTYGPEINTVGTANGGAVSITSTHGSVSLASINSSATSGSGGNISVTSSAGSVDITGVVNASAANGGTFTGSANTNFTSGGAINTSGTSTGGNVSITSTNGSVIVDDINTSGTVGGNITLQATTADSSCCFSFLILPTGNIQFNGTALNASGGGAISLNPAGNTFFPLNATIAGNYATQNSMTFTGGTFTMGANESMTVFNNITINMTGAVTVSDIVALNDLSITGSSIYLTPRAAASILSYQGLFYPSSSAHLLSGNAPSFSTAVTPAGSHTGKSGATLAMLYYAPDAYVLNFDNNTATSTSASSTLSTALQSQIVNEFAVANAQLFDLLPMIGRYWQWSYRGLICNANESDCGNQIGSIHSSFLLEDRIKE